MDEYLRIRLLGGNKRTAKPGPTYVYLFSHKGQASFTEIFHGGRESFYGKWIRRLPLYTQLQLRDLRFFFVRWFSGKTKRDKRNQVIETLSSFCRLQTSHNDILQPASVFLHLILLKYPELCDYSFCAANGIRTVSTK